MTEPPRRHLFSFYFFKFIHLFWERECVCATTGGAEGKWERKNPKFDEPKFSAELELRNCWDHDPSQNQLSSNPGTMEWWPEPKPRVGHLTDWTTQVPQISLVLSNDVLFSFVFFWSLFIYFERDRDSMSWGGTERKRQRISSRLHTANVQLHVGLNLWNCEIMTWA